MPRHNLKCACFKLTNVLRYCLELYILTHVPPINALFEIHLDHFACWERSPPVHRIVLLTIEALGVRVVRQLDDLFWDVHTQLIVHAACDGLAERVHADSPIQLPLPTDAVRSLVADNLDFFLVLGEGD